MVDDILTPANPKRLYRSREKVIAGVCAGLADRFGWDTTLVRVAFAVLFLTGVLSSIIIVYLVLWAITPVQPFRPRSLTPDEERFWNTVSDRPAETFSSIRYKYRDLDDRLAAMERVVTSEEWRLKRQFKDLEGA
jgi:phage shock protein C